MITRAQALGIRQLSYEQRETLNPVEIDLSGLQGAPDDPIVAAGSNFSRSNPQLVPGGFLGEMDLTVRVLVSRLAGFTPREGQKFRWRKQGEASWRGYVRIDRVAEPDASPCFVLRCVNDSKK